MVSTLSARDLGQLLYLLDNDMVNKNSLESLCTRLHQNFHKQVRTILIYILMVQGVGFESRTRTI